MAKTAEPDEASARAMDAELRKEISNDFREAYRAANGENYDEAEMESGAKDFIRDVLPLIVRNAGKYREAQAKIDELASKAREGNLAQGVEVYQFHETDLSKALDAIPAIPEAVLKENPHSVESTVASLLKQDGWKERYDKTRKEVLELLLGPRAFSQAELDNMREGGVDIKEFQKKRQKGFLDRRRKLAVSITQALLLRGVWEQTAKDAEAYRSANDELDILHRSEPKTGDPEAPPPVKKSARDFVSAIDGHLEEITGHKYH
jgi:hypothetical protein